MNVSCPAAAVDPRAPRLDPEVVDALVGEIGVARIHLHGRVDSTNEEGRRLARQGAPDRTLIVASEQTAGRGRRRRHWRSEPGGLYVTMIFRPRVGSFEFAVGLQLAAGIAVAEAITPFTPQAPDLLWPNDVLCRGQKVAGVLVESDMTGNRLDAYVCGIGINVAQPAALFGGELDGRAASLAMLSGEAASLDSVLLAVVRRLLHWDRLLRGEGIAPVIRRWSELGQATLAAESVEVETADGVISGAVSGLSERGGLLVRTGEGLREILTGELIRVRRRS